MPVRLLCKPFFSTSSNDFQFSQFSSQRGIMKHCKDSDSDMDDERDVSHHPLISLESYGETEVSFHHLNQTSNERKKDLATFQPLDAFFKDSTDDYSLPISFGKRKSSHLSRKVEKNHKSPADDVHQTKPFSLILPRIINSKCKRSGNKRIEMENSCEKLHEILRPGMILLKNYLCLIHQVKIVNKCEELGKAPGGFYQPGYKNGAKLRLQMMCLGRNWDPQMKYDEDYRSDGSRAPPIPDELILLVKTALQDSRALINSEDDLPLMSPDVCIVNFYTTSGRLGLHQDRDESCDSLSSGLPVVSVSIGDSAVFLYGDKRDTNKAKEVVLESGDVLIFGGKSRHIFHGVKSVIPDSAPLALLKQTMLRPGRLNLTFRQF